MSKHPDEIYVDALIERLRDRADAIGMDSLKSGSHPRLAIFGDIANEITEAADLLEARRSSYACLQKKG